MKRALGNALKIAVPLGIGVWLIYKQYHDLDPAQRDQLFAAFRAADLRWVLLALAVGVGSHMSRGWRWRYLLEPLGHKPGFWNCYNAVMSGYFMNLFLPRAGEASRAASLYRTERVPFEQGFGTILAERAVDVLMLLVIAALTLAMQWDKLDLFQVRIEAFRAAQGPAEEGGIPWLFVLVVGVVVLGLAGAYLLFTRPALRARVMDLIRGFGAGVQAVFRTKRKGGFLLHTLLIWSCYILMFHLGFLSIPGMDAVPFAGILAGFVAGTIGIALVQGGIGVYPAFVALIISIYMPAPADGGLIRPDALALGWLLWLAQTVLIIVLGGLSLLLVTLKKRPLP
ncbi:MAG: lysylphosphatidylglycerol synthase transmembrane domain-containing protein [Flavobacteriales bacterium]